MIDFMISSSFLLYIIDIPQLDESCLGVGEITYLILLDFKKDSNFKP
jgi:hypothetical protein